MVKDKIFKITINGLEESAKGIKSLNAELNSLINNINKVNSTKIKVSGSTADTAKKVTSSAVSSKELEIQRQITAEKKATAQAQAALTKEYQDSLKAQMEQKQIVAEVKQATKDMLTGAKDEAGNYTNTLNGLRAALRDVTKEFNMQEQGTEKWKELNSLMKELNTTIGQVEQSHGDFRRNVGNYPTKELEAFNKQYQQLSTRMIELQTQSVNLNRQLAQQTQGSPEYDKIKTQLDDIKKGLSDAAKEMDNFNNSFAGTTNNASKFTVTIGGTVREFSSMRNASRQLNEELQQMYANGQVNTKQFNDTINALGRLRTAMTNVTGEVATYIGGMKGLNDAMVIMRGATGLAQIGAGLQQLFGDNKDIAEALKQFTAITLLMSGLNEQAKALNDKTSAWGRILNKVWSGIKRIAGERSFQRWQSNIDNIVDSTTKLKNLMGGEGSQGIFSNLRGRQRTDDMDAESARLVRMWSDTANKIKSINVDTPLTKMTNGIAKFGEKCMDVIGTVRDAFAKLGNRMTAIWNGAMGKLNTITGGFLAKLGITGPNVEAAFRKYQAQVDKLQELSEQMRVNAQLGQMTPQNADWYAAQTKEMQKLISVMHKYPALATLSIGATSKLATAMKGLGVAVKYTAGTLVQITKWVSRMIVAMLAMQAVLWIFDKLKDGWNELMNYYQKRDLADVFDVLKNRIAETDRQMQKYLDTLDAYEKNGFVTATEAQALAIKAFQENVISAGEEMKGFIDTLMRYNKIKVGSLQVSAFNENYGDKTNERTLKYLDSLNRFSQGRINEGGWWSMSTEFEELQGDTKRIIAQIQKDIDSINYDDPAKATQEFSRIVNNELYRSAMANMDKILPKDEWAKNIKEMFDTLTQNVDNAESKIRDFENAVHDANAEMERSTEESLINAIEDSDKRAKAQMDAEKKRRQKAIQDSLADQEHKNAALEALDKEYAQRERDLANKNGEDRAAQARDIMNKIFENRMAVMKDGLDKEIKRLQKAWDDEIADAKGHAELIKSINEKYELLIHKAREDWYKRHEDAIKSHHKAMLQLESEYQAELARARATAAQNEIDRDTEMLEAMTENRRRHLEYDADYTLKMQQDENRDLLDSRMQYIRDSLNIELDYINEKRELQIKNEKNLARTLKAEQETSFREQEQSLKDSLNERLETLKNNYESGLLNEEEYNALREDAHEKHLEAYRKAQETHDIAMREIMTNMTTALSIIDENYLVERSDAYAEANEDVLQGMKDFTSDMEATAEELQYRNRNRITGLFNPLKEKTILKDLRDGYKTTLEDIDRALEDLKQRHSDGLIDFKTFEQGKKNLEQFRTDIVKKAEDTQNNLKDLVMNFGKALDSYMSTAMNAAQTLYSMWNEILNLRFDAEQDAIDREQQMLDRQTEMIDKAYDKQAEIVERYKDAINDTEDELSNARGERRLALIDSLAAQQKAYEEETNALRKQELEKEKIAKKEEALQKRQDELERKRKINDKNQKLVQSIINTALGVTQALGAYPPPISYAFAAAVGAMGAAQTSLIASQKYADGGLVEGNSHANGGVKFSVGNDIREMEGNEYIVNKKSTALNLPLIELINSSNKTLTVEDLQGVLKSPTKPFNFATNNVRTDLGNGQKTNTIVIKDESTPIVQVVDIINGMEQLNSVKVLAGA